MVVGNCRLHGGNTNKYFVEIVVSGHNSTTTFLLKKLWISDGFFVSLLIALSDVIYYIYFAHFQ